MEISNKSPWIDDIPATNNYPELSKNITADVAVVGGGITGTLTAYYLSKAGKKVAIVDKGELGSGETSYSTAMLTPLIDENVKTLLKNFGKEKIKKVWDSLHSTIDEIGRISVEEKIECDFRIVNLHYYSDSTEGVKILEKVRDALNEIDVNVELKKDDLLGFNNFGYLTFPHHATFHQRAFVKGLLKVIENNGGELFENSLVTKYCCQNPTKVTTEKGEISADFSVVATHQPNNGELEVITRTTPMQSYVIEAWMDNNNLPLDIFINTEDPYKYFKVDKVNNKYRLILGGGDHPTGEQDKTTEEIFYSLEEYLVSILGSQKFEIKNRWSAQYFYSGDGLPYVGRSLKNNYQLFATGFGGDGLIFGSLSAKLMSDIVLGKEESELLEIFSPKRVLGVRSFIQRGVAITKGLVLDKFSLKDEGELKNLKLEEGTVLKIKGKPTAVYKNKSGELIKRSAICTHQGCVIKWNSSQKTWDCPCHGSRFKTNGEVLAGPAKKPLENMD